MHTNGNETDILDYVKKRKVPQGILSAFSIHLISGPARSDEGRRCRDTFASLKKTCRKLGISFWHYLTDRLGIGEKSIDPLPSIIIQRAMIATGY